MRFLSLSLLKYGAFTNVVVDLSTPERGLHLLYGANEAGKSTTLRAITGFLYGIPKHTPDAYLHKMPDLRVGARLEGANGAVLDVIRRKGVSNTLLDPEERAVDEAALRRMLGGVGEEAFTVMFGLSHEALRRGGQALLEGKGDLGESLFGAGLGQTALHEVREELEGEAEELFTQKARVRPLNDAIRAFTEAQKKARDLSLSSEDWLAKKKAIEDANEDQKRLAEEAKRLRAEQHRLRRAKQTLPLLGRRRQLEGRLAELAGAVRLPESAARDRDEATRTSAEAADKADRLAADIAGHEARRATLVVPMSLLEQADALDDIQGRLGSYRKAQAELPKLKAELQQLRLDAETRLRRLGSDVSLDRVETLRVDAAAQARVKRLSLQPSGLREKVKSAEDSAADFGARIERERERLASLPRPRDAGELRREVTRAQRQGDLEQRLFKAEADHRRLEKDASTKLAALGFVSGALADVAALPLPTAESVDRAERQWAEIAKRIEIAEREAGSIANRRLDLERGIAEIQRAGAVPTEAELASARAKRDEAWREIRVIVEGAGDGSKAQTKARSKRAQDIDAPDVDAYEQSVRGADEIADRLRREAARVERLAALLADRDAGDRKAETIRLEIEAKRAEQAKAAEAWRSLFRPSGIDAPLGPAEMRAWLARHATFAGHVERLSASATDIEALRRQIDEHSSDLRRALRAAGEVDAESADRSDPQGSARRPREDLTSLTERGARVVSAIEMATRERESLLASINSLERDQARALADSASRRQDLERWQADWAQAVVPLGLGPTALPEEATAILDELAELFRNVDDYRKTQRHVDVAEQDAEQFEADVDAIVKAHASDLEPLATDQAAAQLLKRYQQGAKDRVEREQIDKALREKRSELEEQRKRRAAAEDRIARLLRAGRAETLADLEAAERVSSQARELEQEIRGIEDKLNALGEGATLEALASEVAAMDADRLAVDLDELERKLSVVEESRAQQDRRLGGLEADLAREGGTARAADAAAEAQESLARIRGLADRYLRSRIAALVLAREIERYRERNQGPILARASDLFQRLTLGAYSGIRAGYDERDQPVLRCVRPDGRESEVTGLSDGARDQLFLSLRLASLERHAATNEPMPLIVDDILIHFDDDRARAALAALGDLAERTQILFFTHHARLCELARDVIPKERLREHQLR